MQGTRVASRYAKSLIILTIEQGVLEEAHKDIQFILKVAKENRDFAAFLRSPVIKADKKWAVLQDVFGGKVSKLMEAYLKLITNKKREIYLIEIAQEFINQYKKKKNILTAVITTASGIDDITRKELVKIVKGDTSADVILDERVDAGIIGGIIVRVEDRQVDASVMRKLNTLKRDFIESAYTKEI